MVLHKDVIKARFLRQVQTEVEELLWEKVRDNKLGIKFRRQHPVDAFVLDFYAPKIRFALELDGPQHYTKDGKEYDAMRAEVLESRGIHTMRFLNEEVKNNIEKVLTKIKEKIIELS